MMPRTALWWARAARSACRGGRLGPLPSTASQVNTTSPRRLNRDGRAVQWHLDPRPRMGKALGGSDKGPWQQKGHEMHSLNRYDKERRAERVRMKAVRLFPFVACNGRGPGSPVPSTFRTGVGYRGGPSPHETGELFRLGCSVEGPVAGTSGARTRQDGQNRRKRLSHSSNRRPKIFHGDIAACPASPWQLAALAPRLEPFSGSPRVCCVCFSPSLLIPSTSCNRPHPLQPLAPSARLPQTRPSLIPTQNF